jgi:hypothetical protein
MLEDNEIYHWCAVERARFVTFVKSGKAVCIASRLLKHEFTCYTPKAVTSENLRWP